MTDLDWMSRRVFLKALACSAVAAGATLPVGLTEEIASGWHVIDMPSGVADGDLLCMWVEQFDREDGALVFCEVRLAV